MAIEAKTKTIGATRYRVRQLGAAQALVLFTQLFRLVGPALAEALGQVGDMAKARAPGKKLSFMDLSPAAVGGALGDFASRLTPEQMTQVAMLFAECTQVSADGSKWPELADCFEVHFSGKMLEMLQWLAFCLEVNYGDFLGAIRAALPSAASADHSPSPSASSGGSGESP